MSTKQKVCSVGCIVLISAVSRGLAQDFNLSWNTVDGGGAMLTTGGGFELSGTIGQPDAGAMTGGAFELVGGFWSLASAGAPSAPGDCDADGDVDLTDFTFFAGCLVGPGGGLGPECGCLDLDGNGDVNLLDFSEFQLVFAP